MTLSTDIVIREPVDPEKLFLHVLDLLKRGKAAPADPQYDDDPGCYVSRCGQGLPAWLCVHYAMDGPLRRYDDEDVSYYQEWEPGWELPEWNDHLVRVRMDTRYAYKAPNGAGCSDLHAWLVTEIGAWLADQNVTDWWWENEFTGEFWPSTVPPDSLGNPERGRL